MIFTKKNMSSTWLEDTLSGDGTFILKYVAQRTMKGEWKIHIIFSQPVWKGWLKTRLRMFENKFTLRAVPRNKPSLNPFNIITPTDMGNDRDYPPTLVYQ